MMTENELLTDRHVFVCAGDRFDPQEKRQLAYIKDRFCGKVFVEITPFAEYCKLRPEGLVYMCGDIDLICGAIPAIVDLAILVIKDLSWNYEVHIDRAKLIDTGEVPINYHDMGVFFRRLFNRDYFDGLSLAHRFQMLTESNKPGNAFRKGIYLTKVQRDPREDEGEVGFNLLRCSSNLDGPTDNFREPDTEIVGRVNEISRHFSGMGSSSTTSWHRFTRTLPT